jgi:hypothetical protein
MSSTTITTRNNQDSVSGTELGADITALNVAPLGQITIPPHDAQDVTYTGANPTTIEYYVGGLAGTLVATQTLTYNGSNNVLTNVVTLP